MKLKKLNKLTKNFSKIRNIAILGLPEKYGVSLDFLLFAKSKNLKVTVYDDRKDVLNKLLNSIEKLTADNIYLNDNLKLLREIKDLKDIKLPMELSKDEKFDIILNSDVLQRFETFEREAIILAAKKISSVSVFFMPNEDNVNFIKTDSNRRIVSKREVLNICAKNNIKILECGYMDMPPFPSGVSLSKESRTKIKNTFFLNTVFFILSCWSLLEVILPAFLRKKISHIFYIVI